MIALGYAAVVTTLIWWLEPGKLVGRGQLDVRGRNRIPEQSSELPTPDPIVFSELPSQKLGIPWFGVTPS